jgi:hypothetical protein
MRIDTWKPNVREEITRSKTLWMILLLPGTEIERGRSIKDGFESVNPAALDPRRSKWRRRKKIMPR